MHALRHTKYLSMHKNLRHRVFAFSVHPLLTYEACCLYTLLLDCDLKRSIDCWILAARSDLYLTHDVGHTGFRSLPPQKKPGRWGGAQSPVRPHCQSVTWSPQDDGCTSLVLPRCSPGALCPIGVIHDDQCCTWSLPPLKKRERKDIVKKKKVSKELNRELLIK